MELKELNKTYLPLLILCLVLVLGVLIMQTPFESTGYASYGVNPIGDAGNFLSRTVKLPNTDGEVPIWGIILTFIMIFCVTFVIAVKLHFFKDREHRNAAIVFSLAASLIAVMATNIVSWTLWLSATMLFIVLAGAFLLFGWQFYAAGRKTITEDRTEMTKLEQERYSAETELEKTRVDRPIELNKKEVELIQSESALAEEQRKANMLRDQGQALNTLRPSIFRKDRAKMNSIINYITSLNVNQANLVNRITNILIKAEKTAKALPKDKRDTTLSLIKQIRSLEKQYLAKSSELMNDVDDIKTSIKSNNFEEASESLNKAQQKQMELEKLEQQIQQKIKFISRLTK